MNGWVRDSREGTEGGQGKEDTMLRQEDMIWRGQWVQTAAATLVKGWKVFSQLRCV